MHVNKLYSFVEKQSLLESTFYSNQMAALGHRKERLEIYTLSKRLSILQNTSF